QQQLQLQLQHHLHLRQLQQQHQQQQQQQNGLPGLPRMQSSPSILPPPMGLDPSAQALQAAQAQQQRDWIQQISSNPLLAPGGVINPHAMSQAMLQNPLLMAQANAISQAMVLAQQQQQLQLQLQQHQQQHQQQAQHQQQQHFQQQHLQQQQQHDHHLHHSMQQQQQQQQQQQHSHPFQQPPHPMAAPPPPPPHGQQQQPYPGQQQHHQQQQHQYSPTETMGINGNSAQLSKNESDTDNTPAPPTKKAARRKGSMAKSMSMDSSSSLVVKSPHRSSRDGFDPLQGALRKKGKSDSISKLGLSPSQQNALANGNSNDSNQFKEESVEAESKQETASPSPSIQQQHDSGSPAPSQTAPTKTGTKKPPHELLTEAEKKANHIASEQKRRQNIRVGFDSLVEIVPTLSDCHRSEAVILQKSVDYIHRLLSQKNELKSRVRDLQTHLGDPVDDVDSGSDMEVEQYE
ncbi:hypothetical protein BGX24_009037, partial [Mortierella sp. AD032]